MPGVLKINGVGLRENLYYPILKIRNGVGLRENLLHKTSKKPSLFPPQKMMSYMFSNKF